MMDIQHNILCATILTAVFIAGQSKLASLFPVWAVVAISPALPAVVIWATVMGIKAFVAAVFGQHTRRLCSAIECVATMLADKLLGMAFHRGKKASSAAIVPDGMGRASIKIELLATPLTDKLDEWMLSHGRAMSLAFAFTRAAFAVPFGRVKEDFATNGACIFDAGNTSGHLYTSGSISPDFRRGTFPGKNACRRIANPPKPSINYTTIGQICQGEAYAKC